MVLRRGVWRGEVKICLRGLILESCFLDKTYGKMVAWKQVGI